MEKHGLTLVQKLKVLNLYKNLYKSVRGTAQANKDGEIIIQDLLRNEFRQSNVTDAKYCMEKDVKFYLANAYASYLNSTANAFQLYATYCRGERSIEESARIVGLRLPKQYDPSAPKN